MHGEINSIFVIVMFGSVFLLGLKYYVKNYKDSRLNYCLLALGSLFLWSLSDALIEFHVFPEGVNEVFHYWISHFYIFVPALVILYLMRMYSDEVKKN